MPRKNDRPKIQIGDPAPYFSLKATDNRIYSLADFTRSKVLVVLFTSNHCPQAEAYEQRLCQLVKEYESQGMQLVGICSNDSEAYPQDNFENMLLKSKELGFPFPYLQDLTQDVARAYDAVCTPETYLFDKERKLRYHGLIDDCYQDPDSVNDRYLAYSIEAVLADEPPTTPQTRAVGCPIRWRL